MGKIWKEKKEKEEGIESRVTGTRDTQVRHPRPKELDPTI
jgi:hypothetical protein